MTRRSRLRGVWLSLLVVSAVAVGGSLLAAGTGSAAQTITVDDDGGADYASIQTAVNNAAAGDTVEVMPGTYPEQLTVSKDLTLVAPRGATLDGTGLGSGAIAITISGGAAPEISGFTVTGYMEGLYATGTTGDWTLRNVTVRNSSFGAVHASDSSGNWTIAGSLLVDDRNDAVDASNSSGNWIVRDTRVTSRIYAAKSSGQWTLDGVTLNGSFGEGVVARDTVNAWTITNSTIRDTPTDGIDTSSSSGDWTITDVLVANTSQGGIGATSTTGDWSIQNATVRNNTDVGIRAFSTSGSWEIHGSTIVDNGNPASSAGLSATGGDLTGDATRNYWGSCDGPGGAFNGSGDAAVGNVVVAPYYTDGGLTTLSNQTSATCGGSTTFDFGVELQQTATVTRGGDVNVTAYVNNLGSDPVSGTTVELLVDADGDGRFASDEVVANRSAAFAAGEYRPVNLTYSNVQLSSGNYSYMARVTKNANSTRSYTNGTLTVSGGLVAQYDADGDGDISLPEIQRAINDWAYGDLSLADIQELIGVWATA